MFRLRRTALILSLLFAIQLAPHFGERKTSGAEWPEIYDNKNLVAWCIVPFDAKKRSPAERAEMIRRLGLSRVAYDWRQEHVATFEEEILEYKKRGIEYFAFWAVHEEAFKLFEKHNIHPQIWSMLPAPPEGTQEEKVESVAKSIIPLVNRTRQMGCKLALYNHGGWHGEPENMVAVCQWLRKHEEADHVGIVYNFHHGHEHMDRFDSVLSLMLPYLHCLNLNGMNDDANPKILPIGQGTHEKDMLKRIVAIGYEGPIGILDHRSELDAEESLRQNLTGLKSLVETTFER
ncbi:MAG: TIM barrel protein [Planctomycetota bacterium]|nr:TIM barrel protein [Planctomycetota bacterium]